MYRPLAALAALVLVADLVAIPLVGRSGHGSSRVALPASVATTIPPRPVGTYPLTGLPAYDRTTLGRPALSIKVDNAADARPQVGLESADLITEELVEGGLTRLLVTYQSRDAKSVGPVRSARPEDAPLLHELGGGIFAFSGASAGVLATMQSSSGALLVQPMFGDPAFRRDDGRAAPANLFATTAGLYAHGPATGAPPALFTHGGTTPSAGAGTVALTFSGSTSARWTWDAASARYQREQDGTPDVLADGSRVATTNVVILSVATVGSGNYDVLHHQTPVEVLTGSGACWVVRDGHVAQGQWVRPSSDAAMQLVGGDGTPLQLRAGSAWVELVPHPYEPQITP